MYRVVTQSWVHPVHKAVAGDKEISHIHLVSDDEFRDHMSSITAQLIPAESDPSAATADDVRGTWGRRGD